MTFFKHLLLGAAVLFAASAPAMAETKSLGKHGDWTAYASGDKAAKVCYMVSQPKKTMGSDKTRGAPLFTISHRPGQSHLFVVSVAAGYEFKKGSDAELEVGGAKFALFTTGDTAWGRDGNADKAIIQAMSKAGSLSATVKGVPAKGSNTTDTYSLGGFAAALAEINKACGVK